MSFGCRNSGARSPGSGVRIAKRGTRALFATLCIAAGPGLRDSTAEAPDPEPRTPNPAVLRICADPNNLPFSNARGEGFENRIAQVIAREMGATVSYTWWAQRRGFVRNTLDAGACDVIIGMPAAMASVLTTRPYYRSSYVFVTRKDRGLRVHSFDDPALRSLRIGVQLIGDDYTNTPPAHALASRHLITNVTGYTVYGDYRQPNPPARIIDAVARGDVDIAIAWGPLAGYFATRETAVLEIVPVSPPADLRFLPFSFDIALAVRAGDVERRDRLDAIVSRVQPEIDGILDAFGVPRAPPPSRPS